MCRRGNTDTFYHCKLCGYCRPISDKNAHKCIENVADDRCPICWEVLKFSTKGYISFPCGHLIHVHCSSGYNSINCPICGMAIQKLSKKKNEEIEKLVEETKSNLPK
jgi:RING finger/CHY zinc finger protein 1